MATLQQIIGAHGLSFAAGGRLSLSYTDAITAHAGGGQGSAVLLPTNVNNVTTVASAGDSVILPSPTQTGNDSNGPQDNRGLLLFVINSGANTLAVFPDSGSTINAGSANASVSVPAGDITAFWQTSAGAWFTADNASKFVGALTASGLITANGGIQLGANQYLLESAATAITAGTTRTQAGATALSSELNRVDTSTAPSAGSLLGDGVKLPAAAAGLTILVWNNTANPVQLYGAGSDTVNGVAGATGIPMPANSLYLAVAAATGAWMVDGTAMGNSGSFATETAVDTITAHSGGGQGSAVLLTAMMNRVTTVAASNDSVLLPVSKPGMQITVTNAAATNGVAVFPQSGDAINALSANTALAVAAGKTVTFFCYTAGQWHSLLSA